MQDYLHVFVITWGYLEEALMNLTLDNHVCEFPYGTQCFRKKRQVPECVGTCATVIMNPQSFYVLDEKLSWATYLQLSFFHSGGLADS